MAQDSAPPSPDTFLLILSTFPDEPTARRIVLTLVEECAVACGNIIPGLTSIYRWQGAIETAGEVLVLFKTALPAEAAIARIKELHPYEVPEIIALPISTAYSAYAAWVRENSPAGDVHTAD